MKYAGIIHAPLQEVTARTEFNHEALILRNFSNSVQAEAAVDELRTYGIYKSDAFVLLSDGRGFREFSNQTATRGLFIPILKRKESHEHH